MSATSSFLILIPRCLQRGGFIFYGLATRQDTLERHKQKLQELGLFNDNDFNHPIIWIRQRLSQIFGLIQSES